MKRYIQIFIILSLAIMAIFGCSDKSTDPDEDSNEIRPNLTIHVVDDDYVALYRANVSLTRYLVDTTEMLVRIGQTNELGIYYASPIITAEMLDSLTIIIWKTGYLSDTNGIKILYDGQIFNLHFQLTEDTML